jgi:hypothetical protein
MTEKPYQRYGNDYQLLPAKLREKGADIKTIQEQMTQEPKYDSTKRTKRKYTEELDVRLKEIVKEEQVKTRKMGASHKQKLTNKLNLRKTCRGRLIVKQGNG